MNNNLNDSGQYSHLSESNKLQKSDNFYGYEEQKKSSNIEEGDTSELTNYLIICNCCNSTVKINFIDKENIYIKCLGGYKEINLGEELINYLYKDDIEMIEEEKVENLYCREHDKNPTFNKLKYLKFERYCTNCKKNLCRDCNFISSCEVHTYHSLILDDNKYQTLVDYIRNINLLKNETEYNFCKLLEALIYTNIHYPNNNTLKSLNNAYEFLYNKENYSFKRKKGKFITKKNITSIKKYNKEVYKINLDNGNFRNMRYLTKILRRNKGESTLIKLILSGNNISSIKFLTISSKKNKKNEENNFLINLRHLDLARNNLGNNNIEYLTELNCEKLEKLYLYSNNFTNYEIFNIISKKFGNSLKIFFIGFNRLDNKTIEKLKQCKFFELEEIGLNYVFNENSYEKLSLMITKKLKCLYVQNNGIKSLKFLLNMDFENIEEIYANSNNINKLDVTIFDKFNKLKVLNVKDNKIKEIIGLDILKNKEKLNYLYKD